MFKTDGREKPALPKELAGLKGKKMMCPQCGELYFLAHASFADEKCQSCGAQLQDLQEANSKLNGRS